jgi:hypothetical protein
VIADGGPGADYPEPRPVPYQVQGPQAPADQDQGQPAPYPPPPPQQQQGQYSPQGQYPPQSQYPQGPPPPAYQPESRPFPARVQIKAGTWLPVRIEQQLSSDRNQQGEVFYATLAEPIVVNGVVIAHRGQSVIGRVTEAQKAGRSEGTSRLGVEITAITVADGERVDVHTRIVQRNGQSSVGRDLGAMGQATAMGAAIGGISSGGKGAGIGAGIGAAAGLAGVLLTRGRPTEIYPETLLTFELSSAIEVDTNSGAFRYADSRDFQPDNRTYAARRPVQQAPPPPPYYGGVYGPVYGPGWGYGYPYGYGTGIGIVIGRGFGRGYGRRGRW